MKSFAEYIVEANPVVDKQYRSEALRVFDAVVSSIKKLASSNSSQHMKMVWYNSRYAKYFKLSVNVGQLINDKQYKNLTLEFGNYDYVARGHYDAENDKIYLGVMQGRKIKGQKEPQYPTFTDKPDAINYKTILQTVKEKESWIKTVFLHEFIHYLDKHRQKNPDYSDIKSGQNNPSGYFNTPSEYNAHTQDALQSIDDLIDTQLNDIKKLFKPKNIFVLNSAKTKAEISSASEVVIKLVEFYNQTETLLTDKNFAITFMQKHIKALKQNFIGMLTPENKKKFLVRLYQYYDSILKDRLNGVQSDLKKLSFSITNDTLLNDLKKNSPKIFKALRRIGIQ